jgi:Rrf2 family protein
VAYLLTYGAQYALHAVIHLARSEKRWATGKEIARAIGAPQKYLEIILLELRRQGILSSVRGPAGGYALARAPDSVAFAQIVRALSGPLAACISDSPQACRPCPSLERCEIRPAVAAYHQALDAALKDWTVQAVLDRAEGSPSAPSE